MYMYIYITIYSSQVWKWSILSISPPLETGKLGSRKFSDPADKEEDLHTPKKLMTNLLFMGSATGI